MAPWSMKVKRHWTGGAPSISYMDEGGGDVVVLLHEMGGSLRSWDAAAALLSSRYRVIRIDQRGAGQSEKVRVAYGQAELCEDLSAVLEAIEVVEPVLICAVASASATAASYALASPERVRGLVLASPGFGVEGTALKEALARAELVDAQGMRALVDGAMQGMYPPSIRGPSFDEYRSRFLTADPSGFSLAYRAFAKSEIRIEDIAAPALLLAGALDIRPLSVTQAMAARMRKARVEVVERAGHVMQVQRPDAVTDAIIRFDEELRG